MSRPDGGGNGQIVLAPVDQPAQRVCLSFKLARGGEGGSSGWLTVDFSPTTILAGNNIHPATIADPHSGEGGAFPSSEPRAMRQVNRLGFDLLEELCQQAGLSAPLFDPLTKTAIRQGKFHLVRAQWCAYFPTPDVSRFLQLIGVIFDQTIAQDYRLISVADHLCLSVQVYSDPNSVTGVMLQKRHGKKPLFSLVFYVKQRRVADMKQGRSLLPAEVSTIHQNVRFDITAHSEGIVRIVERARRRLKWFNRGGIVFGASWLDEFLRVDAKPTVWFLERAVFILSHRVRSGTLVRRSFSKWLVPFMIDEILRLNIIAGFSRENFHRLVALEDKIAVLWRSEETREAGPWAKRLADEAGCSLQTVYSRREQWLKEYGIDIAVPYALYRDLLFFGQHSLTRPENRSALLTAVRYKTGADIINISEEEAKNFDLQRRKIVGATISALPLEMAIRIAHKIKPESTRRGRENFQELFRGLGVPAQPALFEPAAADAKCDADANSETISARAVARIEPPDVDLELPQESDA